MSYQFILFGAQIVTIVRNLEEDAALGVARVVINMSTKIEPWFIFSVSFYFCHHDYYSKV